jgi:hypothetical protein
MAKGKLHPAMKAQQFKKGGGKVGKTAVKPTKGGKKSAVKA